jgi:HEXXH motif-containing protein
MSTPQADREARAKPASLWRGTEAQRQRHEKSAVALIALRRVLERERPLGGDEEEFLSLYAHAESVDPALFTRVWTDPTAYFWVRLANQLLASSTGEGELPRTGQAWRPEAGEAEPRHALARHLSDFKRFSLALHHLAGSQVCFEVPLRVRLPFALPGTRLSLEGTGEVEIHSLQGGALRLGRRGREHRVPLAPGDHEGISVHRCPEIELPGGAARLQPQVYANLPGVPFVSPILSSDVDFQIKHQDLLREAIRLIELYQPETFQQLGVAMQVVALKPIDAGDYTNVSYSDLPGSFVIGLVRHPYELADTLIHELHHDRLFAIEESGSFFDDAEQALDQPRCYSPWRDDPRPPQGILHAVYVYLPVWRFWRNVCASQRVSGPLLDYARDRVIRIALQLSIGVHQLERHARLSAPGAELLAELSRGTRELRPSIEELIPDPDLPALVCYEDGAIEAETSRNGGAPLSVREAVLEHLRTHAPKAEADELSDRVARG